MSNVELVGSQGTYRLGEEAWSRILDLALHFGWDPAGTLPSPQYQQGEDAGWDAQRYGTPEGQTVTREDAARLAGALERALPDIPEYNQPAPATERWIGESWPGVWKGYLDCRLNVVVGVSPGRPRPPLSSTLEYLRGNRKQWLEELIDFLRRDAFRIERSAPSDP